MIDLHTHTIASDGTYRPRDLVALAAQIGLRAVAVTDHDTTGGNREALQAGIEYGVEVVPGVEISADSPYGSLHIVGLFIRPEDPAMEAVLRDLREFRDERNRKMIALLGSQGIVVTMEELLKEAGGDLVGRPHFAALLVKKGVVKVYQEAFDVYLKTGGKAYLDKKRLPTDQAIAMIAAAGGLPILAHPLTVRNKDETGFEFNLRQLVDQGLRGMEVYYSDHNRAEEVYFADVARRFNLLMSGGTDFHGTIKPDVMLGRGFGNLDISDEILDHLKEALL